MKLQWLEHLEKNLPKFLSDLERSSYQYNLVVNGNTSKGLSLNLGFSCYALKIFYITNLWDDLNQKNKDEWCSFIKSFQKNLHNLPNYSFVDEKYFSFISAFSLIKYFKNLIKKILNFSQQRRYILDATKRIDHIRAETKQAISTLYQVDNKNNVIYDQFPQSESDILSYLNNLDWSKPWNAGAQFSALCVFVSTQTQSKEIKSQQIKVLNEFIQGIVHEDTGTFYKGSKPSNIEIINGTMKVITGLDWINIQIPYPEKIIETFLQIDPNEDGCDLVDIVYVLYMCSQVTSFMEVEIEEYLHKILDKIEKHYFYDVGGFSYFIKKSQTHYYGVKASKGINEPDLHGTLLLIWAISMISKIIETPITNWKVLKP